MNHITSKQLHELKYDLIHYNYNKNKYGLWYVAVVKALAVRGHNTSSFLECSKCG